MNLLKTLSAALLAALFSTPIYAQGMAPWYLGLKAGSMMADRSGFDDANNIGVYGGYDINQDANGTFSLEGEYTRSFSDGDARGGGDWNVETLALYGAYRTAGQGYLKAKVGWLNEDKRINGGSSSFEGSDSGWSFGAGGGYRLGNKAGIEIEYTVIESDLGFLSVGYFTHF